MTVFKINKVTTMNLLKVWHKSLNIIKNAPFKVKKSWFIGTIISRFKPCDFLLLGYMKELVYKPLLTSLLRLKEKTTNTFKNIPEPMVQKAINGMKKWAKKQVGKSLRVKKSVFRRKWLKTRNLSKIMIYQYKLVIKLWN